MTKTAIIGSTSFLARYIITDLENENHLLTLFSREKTNESHLFEPFAYPNSIPEFSIFLEQCIQFCAEFYNIKF